MESSRSSIQNIPPELLYLILAYLGGSELRAFCLTSKFGHALVTPILWRSVTLTDCKTIRSSPIFNDFVGDDNQDKPVLDEHNDYPLIRILLVLYNNPTLASHVRVLTHRCHLTPPVYHVQLKDMCFNARTLTSDPRTLKLIQLAVGYMKNVDTVRVIFGHPNIIDTLLRCFFSTERKSQGCVPVRRLWLEYCRVNIGLNQSLSFHPHGLPLKLDFHGLQSIRFRRLPMRSASTDMMQYSDYYWHYARSLEDSSNLDHAADDWPELPFRTSVNEAASEILYTSGSAGLHERHGFRRTVEDDVMYEELLQLPLAFDLLTWEAIAQDVGIPSLIKSVAPLAIDFKKQPPVASYLQSYPGDVLDVEDPGSFRGGRVTQTWKVQQLERCASAKVGLQMLHRASDTLTSLNLDEVITQPHSTRTNSGGKDKSFAWWISFFTDLFRCRFPNLQSFQVRSTLVSHVLLPPGLFLFDHSVVSSENTIFDRQETGLDEIDALPTPIDIGLASVEFIEAHCRLKSLSWPMHSFFSPRKQPPELASRIEAIIQSLGDSLEALRTETSWVVATDVQSEEKTSVDMPWRDSRRRFISGFATRMRNLRSIKLAGCIPRDERREFFRVLQNCPLETISMNQRMYPLGNLWGEGREWQYQVNGVNIMQPENPDAVRTYERLIMQGEHSPHGLQHQLNSPPSHERSLADIQYGWPEHSAPLIATIVEHFSPTLTHLKLIGTNGGPVFFNPDPIVNPSLAPLRCFPNLRSLTTTCILDTTWEGQLHNEQVVQFWEDARSPTSTALAIVPDPDAMEEDDGYLSGWAREVQKYSPAALAARTCELFAPLLSDTAKARPGGVKVCVALKVNPLVPLYDLDCWIEKVGGEDVCRRFVGPRDEFEPNRRREKLDSRAWF